MKIAILAISIITLVLSMGARGAGELLPDLLDGTHRLVGRMSLYNKPVTGNEPSTPGVELEGVRIRIEEPARLWKGHWNAGQYALPETGQIVLRARVSGGKASFHAQLYGGKVLPAPVHQESENDVLTMIWNIDGMAGERISGLWLEFQRGNEVLGEVEILDFSVWAGDLY